MLSEEQWLHQLLDQLDGAAPVYTMDRTVTVDIVLALPDDLVEQARAGWR